MEAGSCYPRRLSSTGVANHKYLTSSKFLLPVLREMPLNRRTGGSVPVYHGGLPTAVIGVPRSSFCWNLRATYGGNQQSVATGYPRNTCRLSPRSNRFTWLRFRSCELGS